MVTGPSGSGKSVLAGALAARYGTVLLSTDLVRADLGLKPPAGASVGSGLYSPESRATVYEELARRLDTYLDVGVPVVVDGTFGQRGQRAPIIEAAVRYQAPLLLVECTAPDDVVRERQQQRQSEAWTASQGTWEVYLAQKAAWEPASEVPSEIRLSVDTTLPIAEQLRLVGAALGTEG
jgi:predicted kinase